MKSFGQIFVILIFHILGAGLCILFLLVNPARSNDASIEPYPTNYDYVIVKVYPHDPFAFTQGLSYENGFLYEGTGYWGQSTLRKVELETGKILQIFYLPTKFFGEGISLFEDRIYQLTWKSNIGFVYQKNTFKVLKNFIYDTEGWGITHDGKYLILSDGSSSLSFFHPKQFKMIRKIKVQDHNGPVTRLNELEFVNGQIFANIWKSDRIAVISPNTGQVKGWIDLKPLRKNYLKNMHVDVLNGIAYDSVNDRLFVTGKLWPKLFEIKIIHKNAANSHRKTDE